VLVQQRVPAKRMRVLLRSLSPVAFMIFFALVGATVDLRVFWPLADGMGEILAVELLVLVLGQSRIFFSMARDGLLPKVFSRVHKRFKTPHVTTIVVGVVIASIAAFTNIDEMVDLTNIGTLFAFVLVCFGIIILRIKEPTRHRTFKVPLNPIIPLLGVGSCIFLMTGLPGITWIRFIVWLVVGLVVYFSYSINHSLLHKTHATHPLKK